MISGALHAIVRGQFICKQLDLVTVVGREQHTFVYEVLMERSEVRTQLFFFFFSFLNIFFF